MWPRLNFFQLHKSAVTIFRMQKHDGFSMRAYLWLRSERANFKCLQIFNGIVKILYLRKHWQKMRVSTRNTLFELILIYSRRMKHHKSSRHSNSPQGKCDVYRQPCFCRENSEWDCLLRVDRATTHTQTTKLQLSIQYITQTRVALLPVMIYASLTSILVSPSSTNTV